MKPYVSPQGDVISAALTTDKPRADMSLFKDLRLMLGQIQTIYPIDDPNNNPVGKATFVLYDVLVFHPDGGTEQINRCRAMQPFFGGGFNNFFEVLPTNPGPNAKKFSVPRSEKPGTWVLVGLVNGQKQNGVILGAMPHPNSVAVATRPTQSEGTIAQGEFQGFNFEIDNNGAFTATFNGPRDDQGNPVNQNGPTVFMIDKNGNPSISTNSTQSVMIDRVNALITVTNGPTTYTMDQNANTITTVAKTVNLGDSASHKAALADEVENRLQALEKGLTQIVSDFKMFLNSIYAAHVHPTAAPGPPSPPPVPPIPPTPFTADTSVIGSTVVMVAT